MTAPPPAAAPPPGGASLDARRVWQATLRWLRRNLPQTILFALVGAVVGWAINVWWMARRYEGFNVPSGSASVGRGNMIYGTIFWVIASSIVFGAVAYRRAVGKERFWSDLRNMPRRFREVFTSDEEGGWVHLLWGFAVAVVLTQLLSPSISGALAVGVVLSLPSVLGRVIMSLALRIWSAIVGAIQPAKKAKPPAVISGVVASFGTAAALLLGFFVTDLVPKLVLAGGAALIALLLSRGIVAPGGTGMLLLLGAVVAAYAIFEPSLAFADDGGWAECGSNWSDWIGCDGTDEVVRTAVVGGLATAFGSAFGTGLGSVVGTFPSPGGGGPFDWLTDELERDPDVPLTEDQKEAVADWLLDSLENDPDGANLDALSDALRDPEPPPAPPPLLDPYETGTELHVDPDTGLVWWPYDGEEGQWVTRDQAESLVRAEDEILRARDEAGAERHRRQSDADWERLRARSDAEREVLVGGKSVDDPDLDIKNKHPELYEELKRRAEEQSRLEDFDRRVAAAEKWMEEADPDLLEQLDKVIERVAAQGDASEKDLERASILARTAQQIADMQQRWDAEDWNRIEANKTAVYETALKAATIILDPTKGLASGFVWGATESYHEGGSAAEVIGNGVLNATLWRGSHAVGTWARGRQAIGNIGWGAATGSALAAGETAIRGGNWEEIKTSAQVGLVLGGLGGAAEDAMAAGRPPPSEVPTIRSSRRGPQVHYDMPDRPPADPAFYPPERRPDWSQRPATILPEEGPMGGIPRTRSPEPTGIDAGDMEMPEPAAATGDADDAIAGKMHEGWDLDERGVPDFDESQLTPEQLLERGRASASSEEILNRVDDQPQVWERSAAAGPGEAQPGAGLGGVDVDEAGRVYVNERHIGNYDPAKKQVTNLHGDPVRVALDHRGVPVGYVEMPDTPPGMSPVYNNRGELAGYVDEMGRADIGGERVPVAVDGDGNLVPFEEVPASRLNPEHGPPPELRGRSRLPQEDWEVAGTGGVDRPGAGSGDPATGQVDAPPPAPAAGEQTPIDYTPAGNPVYAGDNQPPIGSRDLDTQPRLPVLDADGHVDHYVEAGPREIHYDSSGNPQFVQRQHPVRPTPGPDIDIARSEWIDTGRPMPTPETFDETLARHPLTGDDAPPPAPDTRDGSTE